MYATCPYPEPARSIPYPHILLPEDPSKYYPPIYAWVSQVVTFPRVSPPKPCIRHSFLPYALHAPPISSRFNHPNNIGLGVQIIQLLILNKKVIPVIIWAIGTISKSFRKYLSDMRWHFIKEVQKTFVLGKTHKLREGSNVKIRNSLWEIILLVP
jgi:Sec-independent protein translocase protein TatA